MERFPPECYKRDKLLEGKIWLYNSASSSQLFAGYEILSEGVRTDDIERRLKALHLKNQENLLELYSVKGNPKKTAKGKVQTEWTIVQPYCEGGDLTDLGKNPQEFRENIFRVIHGILTSIISALLALGELHHKNIHAGNILLASRNPLKVALSDPIIDESKLIIAHQARFTLPQELTHFPPQSGSIDWEKVDVCMLGMTMLALLTPREYPKMNHQEFVENSLLLLKKRQLSTRKEEDDLVSLLETMTRFAPEERPTLTELRKRVKELPPSPTLCGGCWHLAPRVEELEKQVQELRQLLATVSHKQSAKESKEGHNEGIETKVEGSKEVSEPDDSSLCNMSVLKDLQNR
jgi:serine/threonine protein kinase